MSGTEKPRTSVRGVVTAQERLRVDRLAVAEALRRAREIARDCQAVRDALKLGEAK